MCAFLQRQLNKVRCEIAPPDAKANWAAPNAAIVIVIFFCAYAFSYVIFHVCAEMEPLSSINQFEMAGVAWLVAMIVLGALTIYLFPSIKNEFFFSISIRSAGIAIAMGIIGANVVAATIRATGRQLDFPNRNFHIVIFVVVVAPVVEELFMRGLLLNVLLKKYAHRKYGILTSVLVLSVLFAGCHDSFWGGLVGQVTLSAVFLAFRRSLAASIIAHSTLNLIVSFPSLLLLRAFYASHF